MNKRNPFIIIYMITAVLFGLLTGCGDSGKNAEQDSLREFIIACSLELGVSDISVISIERAEDADGNTTAWYATTAESEQFGTLTHEQMVDYFRNLYKKADVSIQHHIGCQADIFGENAYGGVQIHSGEHVYMYRYHNQSWLLYVDGVIAWDSADHRSTTENSGDETISIKVPCAICGGDGKTHDAAKDNHDRVQECRNCGGTGKVEQVLD